MRGKDRWRVIGILPAGLRERDDLTFEEVIPAIRAGSGRELDFKACNWFSTYRIHHRGAERFRDRRCFLLGDAAHIHSPVGAQGMNTGLQDAYNLAWKLALVVKGQADAALLDTYEAERMPVAQRLLRTTDRAFKLVVSDSWVAGLFRTQIIARIVAFAMTQRARAQARVPHHLPDRHPLPEKRAVADAGGRAGGAPRAGDRFPWLRAQASGQRCCVGGPVRYASTTRAFNLLVFGQQAPSPVATGTSSTCCART